MIEELLAPMPGEKTAGYCDEDSADYIELDQLMRKYGTLHQNSIDWNRVKQLTESILTQQGKHYRVLSHQITYWLIKQGSAGLHDSLQLLAGYLHAYWVNGYPKPGTAGIKHRRRQIEQILFRIDKQATRILQTTPADSLAAIQTARDQLGKILKKRKIEPGLKQLDQHLKTQAEQPTPAKTPTTTHTAPNTQTITPQDARQTKRLLLQQAEQLNQQQPTEPLGYQIRRHALWAEIQAAPPADQNGKTELSAPPSDLIHHYKEQLANQNSTLELLQRIEQSVTASPFWLQGSSLAVDIAKQLKMPAVADAIATATRNLIKRVPALQHNTFRGGEPYMTKEDLTQIAPPEENNTTSPATTETLPAVALPEWAEQQHTLDKLRNKKGIGAVLEKIEQQHNQHTTPREQSYLKLLASEQLQAAGLHSLAHDLLLTTQRTIKNMTVAEWEPQYLQRLQAGLTQTGTLSKKQ